LKGQTQQTPQAQKQGHMYSQFLNVQFFFEITLLFNEFFSVMPTLNLPMQQEIEHLK
jgi:hypothetical protein